MYANFLIGLREGLEAALVISILLTYLAKTNRNEHKRFVWLGAAGALGLSVALGAFFTFSIYYLPFSSLELIGGVLSIITAALVTWMVLWLAGNAASLKSGLQDALDKAIASGPKFLVLMAFLAVAREGLETALFVLNASISAGSVSGPVFGALIGLVAACALGVLIYQGAIRINLRKFFMLTGFALVFIAAGVLSYGIHDLQEASVLPGINSLAFDISSTISADSTLGTLLKGMFNFTPTPSNLEFMIWVLYLVIVLTLFFRKSSPKKTTNLGVPNQSTKEEIHV